MAMAQDQSERDEALARGYTFRQRAINVFGIALFFGLSLLLAFQIHALVEEVHHGAMIVLAAVALGVPIADFGSGFVHWAADNWGSGSWPIVGGFVQPFRNHHDDPKDMTRHGFVERNGDNSIASMPLFITAFLAGGSATTNLFVTALCLATAWWVLATNQFHAWAHMDEVPKWVRWMQRTHLILPPEHHNGHHRPPHAQNYCITTGWMDAPLRWIRFWDVLEWALTKLTGVEPLHKQRARAMKRSEAPVPDAPLY
jgi:ubiquitin-conjugating enzyme E2 variant